MSSELFESKEDEFKSLYDRLLSDSNYVNKLVGEEKKKSLRKIGSDIEDATLLIQEMEEEVKKAPGPFRMQMIARLRSYKSSLNQVNNKHEELRRSMLQAGYSSAPLVEDDFESMVTSERARLVSGGESLSRAGQSIARSQRVAAETDDIGHNIITELGSQREQLTRTRDRLVDTDEELSRSRRIIKGINRRVITNKVLVVVIIIVEFLILGGLIVWKFFL